jgi:crotonobetainyl-CoA:carnitine CoA-transferase CaiB-like acyl-CoA transferase
MGCPKYLRSVRVLELGDGISGSAASAVLAMFGARVTKLRSESSPLHRLEPRAGGDRQNSVLSEILDAGKDLVQTAEGLVIEPAGFDIVICDLTFGGVPEIHGDRDAYSDWVGNIGMPAWVSISPYGLTGSRARWKGTELTLGAAGAMLGSDPTTERPIKLAGNQVLLSAGHLAALAGCHAIDRHRNESRAVHADVSVQEAAVATGPILKVAHAMFRCTGGSGAKRFGAPAGFFPCKDGIVRISAMEDHQFQALVRSLGSPPWAAQFMSAAARIDRPDELDAHLTNELAGWTKIECEERMQAHGVPATALYSLRDMLKWPQFIARSSFADVTVGQLPALEVGPPFRAMSYGKPAEPTGIRGLRIAEIGHVLAIPLATSVLGAMGAEVTKLEDPRRLDVSYKIGKRFKLAFLIDKNS